jgi:hypothetical protein
MGGMAKGRPPNVAVQASMAQDPTRALGQVDRGDRERALLSSSSISPDLGIEACEEVEAPGSAGEEEEGKSGRCRRIEEAKGGGRGSAARSWRASQAFEGVSVNGRV